MKKIFSSIVLLGMMLTLGAGLFTSCTDYSDDLGSLNDRLEALEAEVATIPGQLEAVNATLEELGDLKGDVEKLQAQVGDAKLSEVIASISTLEGELKDLSDDLSDTNDDLGETKKTVETLGATLKTLQEETIPALQTALDKKADKEAVATELEKVYAKISEVETGIKSWVGEYVAEQLKGYVKTSDYTADQLKVKASIDSLGVALTEAKQEATDANAALETKLQTEIKALETKLAKEDSLIRVLAENNATLIEGIKTNITEIEGNVTANKTAIDALTTKYNERVIEIDGKIKDLENSVNLNKEQIDALLSQIQSIVYVPINGLGHAAKVELPRLVTDAGSIWDGPSSTVGTAVTVARLLAGAVVPANENFTFSINYDIRPAKVAEALVAAFKADPTNFTMTAEKVLTKADEATAEVTAVELVKDGRIKVTAKTNNFSSEAYGLDKYTLQLGLNVKHETADVISNYGAIDLDHIIYVPIATAAIERAKDDSYTAIAKNSPEATYPATLVEYLKNSCNFTYHELEYHSEGDVKNSVNIDEFVMRFLALPSVDEVVNSVFGVLANPSDTTLRDLVNIYEYPLLTEEEVKPEGYNFVNNNYVPKPTDKFNFVLTNDYKLGTEYYFYCQSIATPYREYQDFVNTNFRFAWSDDFASTINSADLVTYNEVSEESVGDYLEIFDMTYSQGINMTLVKSLPVATVVVIKRAPAVIPAVTFADTTFWSAIYAKGGMYAANGVEFVQVLDESYDKYADVLNFATTKELTLADGTTLPVDIELTFDATTRALKMNVMGTDGDAATTADIVDAVKLFTVEAKDFTSTLETVDGGFSYEFDVTFTTQGAPSISTEMDSLVLPYTNVKAPVTTKAAFPWTDLLNNHYAIDPADADYSFGSFIAPWSDITTPALLNVVRIDGVDSTVVITSGPLDEGMGINPLLSDTLALSFNFNPMNNMTKSTDTFAYTYVYTIAKDIAAGIPYDMVYELKGDFVVDMTDAFGGVKHVTGYLESEEDGIYSSYLEGLYYESEGDYNAGIAKNGNTFVPKPWLFNIKKARLETYFDAVDGSGVKIDTSRLDWTYAEANGDALPDRSSLTDNVLDFVTTKDSIEFVGSVKFDGIEMVDAFETGYNGISYPKFRTTLVEEQRPIKYNDNNIVLADNITIDGAFKGETIYVSNELASVVLDRRDKAILTDDYAGGAANEMFVEAGVDYAPLRHADRVYGYGMGDGAMLKGRMTVEFGDASPKFENPEITEIPELATFGITFDKTTGAFSVPNVSETKLTQNIVVTIPVTVTNSWQVITKDVQFIIVSNL